MFILLPSTVTLFICHNSNVQADNKYVMIMKLFCFYLNINNNERVASLDEQKEAKQLRD